MNRLRAASHNEGDISTLCDEVYEFDGAKIKKRESR